ncbi:hypothetical protein EAI_04130, partial [Harpegnathos saltator]
KESRIIVEHLLRSDSTSNIDENVKRVKKLVLENCCVNDKEIAAELNILNGFVHTILIKVLDMRCVVA